MEQVLELSSLPTVEYPRLPIGRTIVRVETRCPRARQHVQERLSGWVACPSCYSAVVTEVAVPYRPQQRDAVTIEGAPRP